MHNFRSPLQCDERTAESETVTRVSPALVRPSEPPGLINILQTRITDHHPHNRQPSIQSSLDGVPFGQATATKDKGTSPDPSGDAVVLDLSYRAPVQTKQKLFELLSTKVGKKQNRPSSEGGNCDERKDTLLYDTSKITPVVHVSQQCSTKPSSLMAKLLTDPSCFTREDRGVNGHRALVTNLGSALTSSPTNGKTLTGANEDVNGDTKTEKLGNPPSSGMDTTNQTHQLMDVQDIQDETGPSVHHLPPPPVNRAEQTDTKRVPPPLKKRRTSPQTLPNMTKADDKHDGEAKTEPKAVWPFLEEIIVRSLARSPPSRSLSRPSKPSERERGGSVGRGHARMTRQPSAGPPMPQIVHFTQTSPGPVGMGLAPVGVMHPLCPPREASPEPPLLAPQQPLPVYPTPPCLGLPPVATTPPEVMANTHRTEECTSASDRDLLSWDVDQVVHFVGSLPKCRDYAEVSLTSLLKVRPI